MPPAPVLLRPAHRATSRPPITPALAIGVCLTVVVAGCARDAHEAAWPDLVTARQQDAIDREWIPAFLPEAARDIRQRNEPASGARIAIAHLPADVAIPECEGPSDDEPALDAEWFPPMRGEPVACAGGWTVARVDGTITMWHIGGEEEATP